MATAQSLDRGQISNPIKVMLADDHPVLRSGVRVLLTAEPDIQVIAEAADGASAVRLALELRPEVVIMDISLPQVGGADATKQILAVAPEIRILILSAHEEAAFARTLLDAHAAGYALKRSACDELVRAIRIVAGGGIYVDPSIAGSLLSSQRRHFGPTTTAVSLSEREIEVIRLVAQGYTSKEMANQLSLSPRTLETYKARAMSKLNLRSRADLIRYAARSGWLRET